MAATARATTAEAPDKSSFDPSAHWRLFLVSAATLYLEIVLIRWLGTEVKIFAFFQNLSLIACFLGFGLGCFSAKDRGSVLHSLIATSVLVLIAKAPLPAWHNLLRGMSAALAFKPDAALWGYGFIGSLSRLDYWRLAFFSVAVLWLFLLLMVNAMIPLGRWVGYYLETASDAVSSYSVNLAGSIAGLWLLAVLALFWLPPSYWFAVAFALVMVSQPLSLKTTLAACALLAVILLLLRAPSPSLVHWSPYQKLQVIPSADQQYGIDVNNDAAYMSIANVSPGILSQYPEVRRNYVNSSYDSPFRFADKVNRVLVVGAGAGNDVAAALRQGAKEVEAVEIDPLIYSLGKQLHPEHPYDSPKVHVVINDARNFLRQTHEPYDVIVFGLLDSHTEFSGYSNMRVDNYVYTEESFRDAKRLLAPGGILVLKFEVRSPWEWMGQRFYTMLGGIFQHPPVAYYVPQNGLRGALLQASVFVESDSPQLWEKASTPEIASFLGSHPPVFPVGAVAPPPTTDDWPYVYHRSHSIPRTYLSRVGNSAAHDFAKGLAALQAQGGKYMAFLPLGGWLSLDGNPVGQSPCPLLRNHLAG